MRSLDSSGVFLPCGTFFGCVDDLLVVFGITRLANPINSTIVSWFAVIIKNTYENDSINI